MQPLLVFFNIAPLLLIFMVPTITMRSFSEEYKSGTFELLKTLPIRPALLVWGKYIGALLVVLCLLVPTLLYGVAVESLSAVGGIDMGATAGSYLGLFFTCCCICFSRYLRELFHKQYRGCFYWRCLCLLFIICRF